MKKKKKYIETTFMRSGPHFVWGFFKAWVLGNGVKVISLPKLVETKTVFLNE